MDCYVVKKKGIVLNLGTAILAGSCVEYYTQ